jgi:hypothetical protein
VDINPETALTETQPSADIAPKTVFRKTLIATGNRFENKVRENPIFVP